MTLTDLLFPSRRRLKQLIASGATIELDEVAAFQPARIVVSNLGFGRELWATKRTALTTDRRLRAFVDARLIVSAGRPVRDIALVSPLGIEISEIVIRYRGGTTSSAASALPSVAVLPASRAQQQ